ncbi:hypothetical protein [Actinoallomurus sp. CA-150999]|uniref:hypothetical protein n=1 Tax=Actinoallomurus sp. CA-150999 TaxID=3239887 RepID=UPI003D8D5BF0
MRDADRMPGAKSRHQSWLSGEYFQEPLTDPLGDAGGDRGRNRVGRLLELIRAELVAERAGLVLTGTVDLSTPSWR